VSTATLTSWVAAALHHAPKAQGIAADGWTNERLREAIQSRFGIRYSRGHVWKIATGLKLSQLIRKARRWKAAVFYWWLTSQTNAWTAAIGQKQMPANRVSTHRGTARSNLEVRAGSSHC
jgi:hypothetical protein